MQPWVVAVYALAAARVVRFVVADDLSAGLRLKVINRIYLWRHPWIREGARRKADATRDKLDATAALRAQAWVRAYGNEVRESLVLARNGGDEPKLVTLLTCPWCASIWIGAAAAPLAWFVGRSPWLLVPALALAFSYVTGWLAGHEGK